MKEIVQKLCERFRFERGAKWYGQKPQPVLESVKLLWDFKIQTDHRIDHNKPDICSSR